MGNNIGATYTSKYGVINGYGVVENGDFPAQAMLIDQWLNPSGDTAPITSKNVLQFTNVDTGFVLHSAVGFKGDSFPAVPYTFPELPQHRRSRRRKHDAAYGRPGALQRRSASNATRRRLR